MRYYGDHLVVDAARACGPPIVALEAVPHVGHARVEGRTINGTRHNHRLPSLRCPVASGAARRRQGTRTTPAGTFGVVSAFGVGNPGTKLSYRTIGSCSWWIEDPSQRDYNRWREDCSHLSTSDNERLADYAGSLYRQAAVLSYNYASPTRHGAGSGAGIFMHYATRYTGGCVAVNSHIWASTSTPTTMTRPRPFSQLICPRASVIRRPSHAGQSSSLAS